ncbi:MAG: hypothetical protein ACK4VI_03100 [Alphaproteobacteria bacterium]
MADEAAINASIQFLQELLRDYTTSYGGGIDGRLELGQIPQGLFEDIQAFVMALRGIEPVSVALNRAGSPLSGAYDPQTGAALRAQFSPENIAQLRQIRDSYGLDGLRAELRRLDVPEIFIRAPDLFLNFVQNDIEPTLAALDMLYNERLLSVPPVASELLAARPAALSAIEQTIRSDLAFFQSYILDEIQYHQQELDAFPANGSEENRNRLTGILTGLLTANENLNLIVERFAESDFSNLLADDAAQDTLSRYILFMQRHNTSIGYAPRDSQYSAAFQEHLSQRIASQAERLAELEARAPNLEWFDDAEREILQRNIVFKSVMDEMVRTGLIVQPDAQAAQIQTPDPVTTAQAVLETALSSMDRHGRLMVSPVLGARDNNAFEMSSRMATQNFLIDVALLLRISNGSNGGVYTPELRSALSEALNDPDKLGLVADTYFKGDRTMAAGLVSALDVYSNPELVPDINGAGNIARDRLVVRPAVYQSDVAYIQSMIGRIPQAEMAAMNALVGTLNGYGFDGFLPDAVLSSEDRAAMSPIGQTRDQSFAILFESVYAEAQEAIARNGGSGDLREEVSARMIERYQMVVTGHSLYRASHAAQMEQYLRHAVSVGIDAMEGFRSDDPAVKLQIAAMGFAASIPAPEDFIAAHGLNERPRNTITNPGYMPVAVPQSLAGFGGAIAQSPAILAQAMNAPLLDELLAGGMPNAETQRRLSETRAMLEQAYNAAPEKSADGALILQDRHGERVLVTQGENGIEMRYLSATGISAITDSDIPTQVIGESFGLDSRMIESAMGRYLHDNRNARRADEYNPSFITMGGTTYVMGIDRDSKLLQIIPLDPNFVTPENAAMTTFAVDPAAKQAALERFLQDPAYRFLFENYQGRFHSGGVTDRILYTMAQRLSEQGSARADETLAAFGLYSGMNVGGNIYDPTTIQNDPNLAAQISDELNALIAARPEEDRSNPFVYFDQVNGKILWVEPATTTVQQEINGQIQDIEVFDASRHPVVRDISDPDVYAALRSSLVEWNASGLFLKVDAYPLGVPEIHDQFSGFFSWLQEGAPPPMRQPAEVQEPLPVLEGEARAAALAEFEESVAGFSFENGCVSFGREISSQALLEEILGYNPADTFNFGGYVDAEQTYIIHGLDPVTWNGENPQHELLRDHVFVSFMRGGEVRTIAIAKEDLDYNPLRLPSMLEQMHPGQGSPEFLAANRNITYIHENETIIQTPNIWSFVARNMNAYNQNPPEGVEAIPGRPDQGFVVPRRWRVDEGFVRNIVRQGLADNPRPAPEPESDLPITRRLLRENAQEITNPDSFLTSICDSRAPDATCDAQLLRPNCP